MDSFKAALADAWARFATFAYENQELYVITVVLITMGVLAFLQRKEAKKGWRLNRGRHMTRDERQQYKRTVVADAITDALEQIEYDGKLTRHEVQEEYRKLGGYLKNTQLLPQKLHKDAIKHSLNQSLSGDKKPVNIPGPKPGEYPDMSNVVPMPVRKKFGAKALKSA